jgi:hypothetical protein
MTATPESFGDKLARVARLALIGGIAVVAALLVTSPRPLENPFTLSRAQAEGIAAAPGYLSMTVTVGNQSKFYVIDTNKKAICVYDIVGDKVRLVSARKFDFDSEIFDGSIAVQPKYGRGIEGGSGIDRKEAKEYSEAIAKMWEDAKKK